MPYPIIQPYDKGTLNVSDLHTVHYTQSGNPDGKPVIFLHGGPGGGTAPSDSVYFNPDIYRIVMIDQRGAGESTPPAELKENTTWDLVADIEKLRIKLNIEKWIVFGGSWGSTLTLSYSQTHPDRCKALIMRGIFLLRRSELEFFYQNGASHLWPEAWDEYLAPIPEDERHDMMSAYHKRMASDDDNISLPAATAWSKWELSTSRLYQDPEYMARVEDPKFSRAFGRIECHYFVNKGFFPEDGYLIKEEQIAKIRHLPCIVVQGRYDLVCPARSAFDLKKAWGEGLNLKVVPDAGHSAKEAGIAKLLTEAADEFASL